MSATALGDRRLVKGPNSLGTPQRHPPAGAVLGHDNWPHTKRPLPWLLAGFLVMIFVIPFDSIIFKVHLPANATFDRVLLVVIVLVYLCTRASQMRAAGRRRLTPVEVAVLTFGGIALLSIVPHIDRIYQENQVSFVEKGFSQLLAYGVFFFVVVATIRAEELAAFSKLVLGLTCLTAIGTIIEAHTGYNVFYAWSTVLLKPIAAVGKAPTVLHPTKIVVGPTHQGLALASMLTIGLPFAVLPVLDARRPGERLRYLFLVGLILAADLSTYRKTAIIAPLAAFIVLAAYKRQILRAAPIAIIVLIPVIHVFSPGALGSVSAVIPFSSSSSNADGGRQGYTDGRSQDYPAILPDVLSNVIIGRGYSTMDTSNKRSYRVLDNQYLDVLFEVGVVGLLSYLAVVFAALMTAHGVIKRGGARASPALAAAAGCAAFGILCATYDAAGFPQAMYSFLLSAGLVAVAASKADLPARAWRRARN